jgi:sugar lactone lactonase YvrE
MTAPSVIAGGLIFPEAPRWYDGRLWLSDIHAHKVLRLRDDSTWEVMGEIDGRPSGIGFLPDGTPIVTSLIDRCVFRLDDGVATVYADLTGIAGDFINDMVVDGEGRAYVGSRHPESTLEAPADTVILVDPDTREGRIVARGLSRPNGSVVTPDGSTLVVAETLMGRLTAFDIEPDGSLSGARTYARVAGEHADGICLDAEGGVWFGSPEQHRFVRVLEGGEVTDKVEVPGRWCVAPALGGPDRRTLYMLTTDTTLENMEWVGLDRTRGPQSKSEGRVEALTVDVPGAGWP